MVVVFLDQATKRMCEDIFDSSIYKMRYVQVLCQINK